MPPWCLSHGAIGWGEFLISGIQVIMLPDFIDNAAQIRFNLACDCGRSWRRATGSVLCGATSVEAPLKLQHPKLVKLLRLAYSAEKAAAFAYIGHAGSVKRPSEKEAIRQIELDEWGHRESVLAIMRRYDISPSRYLEFKYHVIGKMISASCYVIGWFMPYYFAGRLESGNVCEYFVMMRYFNEMEITEHDAVLYEMGIKEKEHEEYFLKSLEGNRLLPLFERIFGWGKDGRMNDVDLQDKATVEASKRYCQRRK